MAAKTITQIIRLTLKETEMSDADADDTFVPLGTQMFESITEEDVTVASDTTGDTGVDTVIAYFAIAVYYSMKKESYMVSVQEGRMAAYVWWEQAAFRLMVTLGYGEYLAYDRMSGMYYVSGHQKVLNYMAVKDLTGGYGDV